VTSGDEIVQVLLREEDGEDRVVLLGKERRPAPRAPAARAVRRVPRPRWTTAAVRA
jgi:hypothetical protein